MQAILRQIYYARRRWIAAQGFQFLGYVWGILFSIMMVLLIIPKLVVLPWTENRMVVFVIGATAMVGLLIAAFLTWWNRPSVSQAAIEVDIRMQLKERFSSVLAVQENDRDSGIAKALVADAAKTAERIDVRDAFPLLNNRRLGWAFLPLLLSIALLWIPNATASSIANNATSILSRSEIEKATKPIIELLKKEQKEAEENGLEEAAEFYKKLEKKLEDLQRPESKDNKKLLTDLNGLKQELEKRREQLGSSESLKKNLAAMKQMADGPAEKMAEAMKEGDFDQASEEVAKMIENLEKGNLSKEEIEKLSKQLDSMAQAFEKAAAQHEQEKADLEKKIEQAEQAGDMQKAASLRKELADKESEDASMSEMAQLAEQMKSAKDSLQKGDSKEANKAMGQMKSKLDKMSRNSAQSKALDKILQKAKQAKGKATGKGSKLEEEDQDCDSEDGTCKGKKNGPPKWKRGKGEGSGSGPRDEEESETDHVDSQVRNDIGEGESVYAGKAGGANRKGVTREETQQAIRASEPEDEEALETIVLPKRQRDQTRDYFDKIRK